MGVSARRLIAAAGAAMLGVGAVPAAAQLGQPAWTTPIAPFNVLGPIDYVGTEGLGAYLIRTPEGAILIDAPMEENVAALTQAITARGVALKDVKLILLSHAHFDHAGGIAALKRATGARLVVGARDKPAVETGVPPSDTDYGVVRFPGAPVDLAVADGGQVALGGVTLTAIATAGHTPGCTSWKMRLTTHGAPPRDILFACSLTVAGNRLVGNRGYPGIVDDFRRTFDRFGRLEADVVLTFHPDVAALRGKARAGTLADRTALPRMVAGARTAFDAELARQAE